jgi:hypothetical protein
MQFSEFVFGLSTSFIATLSCQPSSAFTLTQRPRLTDYLAVSDFKQNGKGYTSLNVLDPDNPLDFKKSTRFVTEIERGGTKGLLNDLKLYTNLSRKPWSFKRGRD